MTGHSRTLEGSTLTGMKVGPFRSVLKILEFMYEDLHDLHYMVFLYMVLLFMNYVVIFVSKLVGKLKKFDNCVVVYKYKFF